MKTSVSQQQLAHGLGIVSRAVSPRSTLPVLGNVLIATDEGRLRFSATNLELGISCWVGAQIIEDGSITIPARTFSDLINTLPNDNVTLTLNNATQTLNVTCGASVTDIKGIDAQEFPPMHIADMSEAMELNTADMKEMIQQVVFAASSDEARPVLQGVMVNVQDSEITMAATDGFRISVRKAKLSTPATKPFNIIVPARALSELARISNDNSQVISMIVPAGRGQVIFKVRDAELVSQLIEGQFPDYKLIIPRSFKTHTVLSTTQFLNACRQAEIIARDSNFVIRLKIDSQPDAPGQVEISAQSEETGASDVRIDATIEGSGIEIAYNVRYLREVLDVIKTPNVILENNANNTPGLIKPVSDDNFLHVIMPMHLG